MEIEVNLLPVNFFPTCGIDENISQNRFKAEAKAMTLLCGLSVS
jgi:hypothetical protein